MSNALAWEIDRDITTHEDWGYSTGSTAEPVTVPQARLDPSNKCYDLYIYATREEPFVYVNWPRAFVPKLSNWSRFFWSLSPGLISFCAPRVLEAQDEPHVQLTVAYGSNEDWPSGIDEEADYTVREVFAASSSRVVILSQAHEFRTDDLPQWKPYVILDEWLMKHLEDDE